MATEDKECRIYQQTHGNKEHPWGTNQTIRIPTGCARYQNIYARTRELLDLKQGRTKRILRHVPVSGTGMDYFPSDGTNPYSI